MDNADHLTGLDTLCPYLSIPIDHPDPLPSPTDLSVEDISSIISLKK